MAKKKQPEIAAPENLRPCPVCGRAPRRCGSTTRETFFWYCSHGGEARDNGDISGPNQDPDGLKWNTIVTETIRRARRSPEHRACRDTVAACAKETEHGTA